VTRVYDDWQMAQLLQDRDRAEVESIPGRGLKSANSTLAQDNLAVAAAGNIFRGKQKFLDRGAQAPFEQNRHPEPADLLEERVILHVA
jgi:hypothetical protein